MPGGILSVFNGAVRYGDFAIGCGESPNFMEAEPAQIEPPPELPGELQQRHRLPRQLESHHGRSTLDTRYFRRCHFREMTGAFELRILLRCRLLRRTQLLPNRKSVAVFFI